MDTISAMAASGLRARMQELDMLANNLANSGTGGFKLDREFYSLFTASDNDVDGEASPSTMPLIRKQWTDFAQGNLTPTGNPLDVAISGQGFFVASGPGGNLYTRNGSFQISPDGTLTTNNGYPVLATDGSQIQLSTQGEVTVGTDGTVSQNGQSIAQLQLVDFTDKMALRKMANSYFQAAPKQEPVPATSAEVQQGRVEGSNVAPAESAVRLVGVMRQFEMLQKAISVTADMDKKSLDEVARVAPGA